VADQPGFADELLAHFKLPTRSGFSLPSCFCRHPFWVPFANSHVSRSWVPARNSRLQTERERGCVKILGGWKFTERKRETHTQSVCARVRACVNILDGWKFTEREREMGIGLHFGELGCSGGCHCCCSREPSNHCYTLAALCPPVDMRWM
jgi:hypothetical protein